MSDTTSKNSLILGIAIGVAAVSLLGFLMLLGKGSGSGAVLGSTSGSKTTPTVPTTAPPPTPSGPPQPTNIQLVAVSDDDHILGNRKAKISIVEFSDIQCPFCQRIHPTLKQIVQDYDGKVNWVYRHFPLDSIHPQARPAAVASECVAEQDRDAFWPFVDKLFASQSTLGPSLYEQTAQEVGVNVNTFKDCTNSGKYDSKVANHLQQATAAGGRGTPYSVIVVGDQKIPLSGAVPISQIKAAIDPLL